MSALQVVALCSRLFSIWLFISAMAQISLVIDMRALAGQSMSQAAFLWPLATGLAAVLMWLFPLGIANKLIPRTEHPNVIRMPAATVCALATATLGLWTIVQAIPDIIGVVHEMTRGLHLSGGDVLWFLLPFLRLGVGLLLLNKPWLIADRFGPETAIQK